VAKIASGMQADPDNEIVGLEGRTEVLVKLSEALQEYPEYFGADGRPGNLIGEPFPYPLVLSYPKFYVPF
jgi:hypothetical protein